jgi:hypothetical protein
MKVVTRHAHLIRCLRFHSYVERTMRTKLMSGVIVSLFHLLLQAFVGLVLYVMWTVCLFRIAT